MGKITCDEISMTHWSLEFDRLKSGDIMCKKGSKTLSVAKSNKYEKILHSQTGVNETSK